MSRDCREFLGRLADLLVDAGSGADAHATACDRCAGVLAAARRQERLLRDLPRPSLPPAMLEDGFLGDVAVRVVDRVHGEIGPVLERGIAAVRAPEDLEWAECEAPPAVTGRLRDLPRRRAPGWLWSRIRAGLRAEVASRRRRARRRQLLRAGVLAASLVLSVVLFRVLSAPAEPEIRVFQVDRPFAPTLVTIARSLAGD